jgi:hypothetical protein
MDDIERGQMRQQSIPLIFVSVIAVILSVCEILTTPYGVDIEHNFFGQFIIFGTYSSLFFVIISYPLSKIITAVYTCLISFVVMLMVLELIGYWNAVSSKLIRGDWNVGHLEYRIVLVLLTLVSCILLMMMVHRTFIKKPTPQ